RQGLDEVRRSVALLREGAAARADLLQTLAALAQESSQAGLPTQLEVDGCPRHIPEPIEFTLYRAAQEALTNARRHARASEAQLRLCFAADEVQLDVLDDGVGNPAPVPGFGFIGLRERAELIGARLEIGAGPQRGFHVRLSVRA
ncbi:MAG TPA: ATP-binding protein, partial [Polyangiales bacterium]